VTLSTKSRDRRWVAAFGHDCTFDKVVTTVIDVTLMLRYFYADISHLPYAVYSRVSVIRLSCKKSHSFVRPIGIVSSRILYMALYGRLFSLVRPSKFYVQSFESRLGRITAIPLYTLVLDFGISACVRIFSKNMVLTTRTKSGLLRVWKTCKTWKNQGI